MKKKICILGAGLTGLTVAYKLKMRGFEDYLILDKDSVVGGTAKTIHKDGWKYDLTGHALHLKTDKVKNFLFQTLSLEEKLQSNIRNSAILFRDTFIPYPFQYNLSYLPKTLRNKAVIDFLDSYFDKSNQEREEYISLLDYCLSRLGNTITALFMKPYNEKLWSTLAKDMGIEWMGDYVPEPKLIEILKGAFIKDTKKRVGYNANFYYPKLNGIQTISEKLAEVQINNLKLETKVLKIDTSEKCIITNNDNINYDIIVNTIPLNSFLDISNFDNLLKLFKPRFTIVNAFFVSIPKDAFYDFTWIYVPSKKITPYRIGNFSRFSPNLSNDGKDLIYVECSKSNVDNKPFSDFSDITNDLCKILSLYKNDIDLVDNRFIDPAYVVYNQTRKKYLSSILRFLYREHKIISIGRYGAWKYDSMEGAIIDGIEAARKIEKILGFSDYKEA